MKNSIKYLLAALTAASVIPTLSGCTPGAWTEETTTISEAYEESPTRYTITEETTTYSIEERESQTENPASSVTESGSYTSMAEVSEYIHEYGHLPDNYITKSEAKKLGWKSSEGNLSIVAPGMSIGGDVFGNREGLLPKAKGRTYYECDIDYTGGSRNAKRLIYSDDGLIFYTEDHYNTFEQLY